MSDGKLSEPAFQPGFTLTYFPLMDRGTPLKLISALEQGTTKGHHSPSCSRGSALGKPTCQDSAVERKKDPGFLPKTNPPISSHGSAAGHASSSVLAVPLHGVGQLSNSPRNQTSGGRKERGGFCWADRVESAQKRLAQVIGKKQKIF